MKILADENITNVERSFARYGEVVTVPGRSINSTMLQDVDALLVRSITPVDATLLQNTPCRFVGTATSGIDHIDIASLEAAGIAFGWARGCNSISVVDYVFSSLARLSLQASGVLATRKWRDCSVGIIGCGEIGGKLAQRLESLGMPFKIHDPFITEDHRHANRLTLLDEVLRQDVITLHVPLTVDGAWPTLHLLNDKTLSRVGEDSVLINAARGAVIDNRALLEWITDRPMQTLVLDTWEGEPDVNLQLLQKVNLGTPHIAGYSLEGKLKGTAMLVQQFCQHFGYSSPMRDPDADNRDTLIPMAGSSDEQLNRLLLGAYDIGRDHKSMLGLLSGLPSGLLNSETPGQAFDNLRKQYPVRHEYSHFRVAGETLRPELKSPLQALGFQLVD